MLEVVNCGFVQLCDAGGVAGGGGGGAVGGADVGAAGGAGEACRAGMGADVGVGAAVATVLPELLMCIDGGFAVEDLGVR